MAHNQTLAFSISSRAVQNNEFISAQQAGIGCGASAENISPDLEWTGVPIGAKSLALVVHDPDAPRANGFYHWIVVDIPPTVMGVAEGANFAPPARELNTDFNRPGYNGPCPPPGSGPHRYHFTLYALGAQTLEFSSTNSPHEIASAIEAQSIAQTAIIGLYGRD